MIELGNKGPISMEKVKDNLTWEYHFPTRRTYLTVNEWLYCMVCESPSGWWFVVNTDLNSGTVAEGHRIDTQAEAFKRAERELLRWIPIFNDKLRREECKTNKRAGTRFNTQDLVAYSLLVISEAIKPAIERNVTIQSDLVAAKLRKTTELARVVSSYLEQTFVPSMSFADADNLTEGAKVFTKQALALIEDAEIELTKEEQKERGNK